MKPTYPHIVAGRNPARTIVLALAMLGLLAGPLVQSMHAQAIDLQAQRLAITSIASNWRFHAGDDPRWSQASFDDSGWKLIQPSEDWTTQGYSEENGLAWFRLRLLAPANTRSLVIQLPGIDKSYQLFADGRMIGQVGSLPPQRPLTVTTASRVFTLPVNTMAAPREVTLALRLWQEPRLRNIRQSVLRGQALVGAPAPMLRQFAMAKGNVLLHRGGEYTQALIVLIIGAATVMLLLLTREWFYLWFTINLTFIMLDLPVRLASQHFSWSFSFAVYLYIFIDFGANASFALFLAGLLNLRDLKKVIATIAFMAMAELGPLFLVLYQLPLIWADGIYFVFTTAGSFLLVMFLVQGWRRGVLDARLMIFPYGLALIIGELSDLSHWLDNFGVPWASRLDASGISLMTAPFNFSLNDAGSMLALCGFLAVLVHRFARTSLEQQRLSSELQAAHVVQQRLVPVDIPSLGGLRTEIVYLAAEEVGGDFCQVLPRSDGSILVVIGDVSGKGLQAAMLGTLAVGALRSMADEDIPPAGILHRLNQVVLSADNPGFITCLCLKLSPAGVAEISNAGHLSPYLNGQEMAIDGGLPLGIIAEPEYSEISLLLPETSRLTLLSDGVVEARADNGELFGFDRTSRLSHLSASEIAAAAHKHGQQDDITVITLDWRTPSQAPDLVASGAFA